jgi:hypothetical protein
MFTYRFVNFDKSDPYDIPEKYKPWISRSGWSWLVLFRSIGCDTDFCKFDTELVRYEEIDTTNFSMETWSEICEAFLYFRSRGFYIYMMCE